ncbi:MAG: hypothetical protein JST00_02360 [Deltaproteobacteria bacterium]|nr:hypothetical protein [Deltaproteobacteria bacterium]
MLSVVAAGALAACNAILGISGDVIDERPDSGSTTEGGFIDGAASPVSFEPKSLTLVQSAKVTLTLTAPSLVDGGELATVALGALPPGVKASVVTVQVGAAQPQVITLEANTLTVQGDYQLKLDVTTREGTARNVIPLRVTGPFDTTFGEGGVAVAEFDFTPPDQDPQDAVGLVVTGDGTIVVAFTSKSGSSTKPAIRRFTQDGKPDPSLADGGVFRLAAAPTDSRGAGATELDGGAILVAGRRRIADGGLLNPIAVRVSPTGQMLDDIASDVDGGVEEGLVPLALPNGGAAVITRNLTTSWLRPSSSPPNLGPPITLAGIPTASDAIVQGDDRVLVFATRVFGLESFVGRYVLSSGAPDPSFGDAGVVDPFDLNQPTAASGALVDGGIVVVGGGKEDGGQNSRALVRRLGSDGAPVGNVTVVLPPDTRAASAFAVRPLPDDRVLFGGLAAKSNELPFFARLLPSGALDPDFCMGGICVANLEGRQGEVRRMVAQGERTIAAVLVKTGNDLSRRDVVLVRLLGVRPPLSP